MKNIAKHIFGLAVLVVALLAFGESASAQGCGVTISIAVTGTASSTCFVPSGQSLSYALTGTWAGTVSIYTSDNNGISYRSVQSFTANTSAVLNPSPPENLLYKVIFDSRTSGTVTGNLLGLSPVPGRNIVACIPGLGQAAFSGLGTDTFGVAGTLWIADCLVTRPMTITTIGVLNGSVATNGNVIDIVYDGSGRLLANTLATGTATAGTNAFQEVALVNSVSIPVGHYYAAVQLDNTSDKLRLMAASTFIDTMVTSITGVFGTVPVTITPPTTFTATKGPIVYLKGF